MAIFYYLTENNLRCFSLDRSVAQTSIDLLRQYAMSGNNLKADFRNSLNDMMILATSINSGTNLLTEDRALWSFAARVLSLPLNAKGPLVLLGNLVPSGQSLPFQRKARVMSIVLGKTR